MVQTAKVTKLLPDGRAEVAVQRQSACGHDCSQCGGGCSEMMVSSTVAVVADNLARAVPGDSVQVESETRSILGAAVMVYLVPFLLFFVGYFVGVGIGFTEGVGAALGGVGFALGVLLAIGADRRIKKQRGLSFRITAIVSEP